MSEDIKDIILSTILPYLVIFIFFTPLFCIAILMGKYTTENGIKIGTIVKCASQGIIFKTYECELIRGGFSNGSGTVGKSFDFTVKDKEVIETVNNALETQKEIKLTYHKEMFAPTRSQSNGYFLDKLEILKG